MNKFKIGEITTNTMTLLNNIITLLNSNNGDIIPITSACRRWKCSLCNCMMAFVVMIDEKLICIHCRYNDIGKDAFYEGLYNGMD